MLIFWVLVRSYSLVVMSWNIFHLNRANSTVTKEPASQSVSESVREQSHDFSVLQEIG